MKPYFAITFVVVLLLAAACVQPPPGSPIQVSDPWARASTGPNGAAYMVIRNTSAAADRLLEARADVATTVELHKSGMKDGVMTMAPVEGGIEVPAGGQAELKPGGLHVMFIGLTRELKAGEKITLELRFEKAGEITVQAEVRQP